MGGGSDEVGLGSWKEISGHLNGRWELEEMGGGSDVCGKWV